MLARRKRIFRKSAGLARLGLFRTDLHDRAIGRADRLVAACFAPRWNSPRIRPLTPNPSKAPWYFVGLQELLTYSDAWNVGVVVPALAILGLMAIPYLDRNPTGSGYYSIRGRRFACFVFLFGFLQLWILPILIGTFLRGPNWSYFGLYEVRDPSKLLDARTFLALPSVLDQSPRSPAAASSADCRRIHPIPLFPLPRFPRREPHASLLPRPAAARSAARC